MYATTGYTSPSVVRMAHVASSVSSSQVQSDKMHVMNVRIR